MTQPDDQMQLADSACESVTLPPAEERTPEWFREYVLPKLNLRALENVARAAIRPAMDAEERTTDGRSA